MSETKAELRQRVLIAEASMFDMVIDAMLCANRAVELYGDPSSMYVQIEKARVAAYVGSLYMLTGEDHADIRKRAEKVVRKRLAVGQSE